MTDTAPLRFCLRRIRLNSGGYDSHGCYYGHGAPIYWACSDSLTVPEVTMEFRASSRDAAKAIVREAHPGAVFYR